MKKCIIIRKENYLHFPTCVQCRSRELKCSENLLIVPFALFSEYSGILMGDKHPIDELMRYPSIIPSMWVCDSPNWTLPAVVYAPCPFAFTKKSFFFLFILWLPWPPENISILPPFPFNSFIIIENISYSQRKEIYKELNIDMEITLHSSLFLSLNKSNR